MSARVSTVHDSAAGVADVHRVLSGPGWAAAKALHLKDSSRVVERVERPDGGVLLVLSRELPPGAPGFLERFLPKDGKVLTRDDWGPETDGVRRGTWSVELPGTPARLGGALLLEPTATGSRYTITGEVKVSVPLIGGKAETFIAGMVERLAVKEAEVLEAELTCRS